MECPKCNKKIETVFVISNYTQKCGLGGKKGNELVDYQEVHSDPIGATNAIICPECDKDISEFVEE